MFHLYLMSLEFDRERDFTPIGSLVNEGVNKRPIGFDDLLDFLPFASDITLWIIVMYLGCLIVKMP